MNDWFLALWNMQRERVVEYLSTYIHLAQLIAREVATQSLNYTLQVEGDAYEQLKMHFILLTSISCQ